MRIYKIIIISVRSQIVAQTQIEWDMGPINPIQQICKRVGERIGLVMGITIVNRG